MDSILQHLLVFYVQMEQAQQEINQLALVKQVAKHALLMPLFVQVVHQITDLIMLHQIVLFVPTEPPLSVEPMPAPTAHQDVRHVTVQETQLFAPAAFLALDSKTTHAMLAIQDSTALVELLNVLLVLQTAPIAQAPTAPPTQLPVLHAQSTMVLSMDLASHAPWVNSDQEALRDARTVLKDVLTVLLQPQQIKQQPTNLPVWVAVLTMDMPTVLVLTAQTVQFHLEDNLLVKTVQLVVRLAMQRLVLHVKPILFLLTLLVKIALTVLTLLGETPLPVSVVHLIAPLATALDAVSVMLTLLYTTIPVWLAISLIVPLVLMPTFARTVQETSLPQLIQPPMFPPAVVTVLSFCPIMEHLVFVPQVRTSTTVLVRAQLVIVWFVTELTPLAPSVSLTSL